MAFAKFPQRQILKKAWNNRLWIPLSIFNWRALFEKPQTIQNCLFYQDWKMLGIFSKPKTTEQWNYFFGCFMNYTFFVPSVMLTVLGINAPVILTSFEKRGKQINEMNRIWSLLWTFNNKTSFGLPVTVGLLAGTFEWI